MQAAFIIIAALTLVSAVAAMTRRNLVHCALFVALAFAGLAAMYLHLSAEFVGFAQILVYIGAVAILIVFTVLLTRGDAIISGVSKSASWPIGAAVALMVLAAIALPILASPGLARGLPPKPDATVQMIGELLMTQYVLPLEIVGLLLTAAMLGAVIIAMPEKRETGPEDQSAEPPAGAGGEQRKQELTLSAK